MRFFIDSSAWIEYLEGSYNGERVHQILSKEDEIYSISLIISEVVSRARRKKQNADIPFRAIISNSKILDITPEIAKEAGILHADMKKKISDFGLVDAIIWTVAKKLNAKLVTCDSHFKGFKEAVLLK